MLSRKVVTYHPSTDGGDKKTRSQITSQRVEPEDEGLQGVCECLNPE